MEKKEEEVHLDMFFLAELFGKEDFMKIRKRMVEDELWVGMSDIVELCGYNKNDKEFYEIPARVDQVFQRMFPDEFIEHFSDCVFVNSSGILQMMMSGSFYNTRIYELKMNFIEKFFNNKSMKRIMVETLKKWNGNFII